MVWARLDDQLYDHPKVAEMSTELTLVPLAAGAMGLHALALSWCGKHLTDGVVPWAQPAKLFGTPVDNLVAECLRVGIWEKHPRGFVIHDYLDYNPSKTQVMAEREAKSKGGRRGGIASGRARREAHAEAYPEAYPAGDAEAYPKASPQAEAKLKRTPEPVPVPPSSIKKSSRSKDPVENPGADRAPHKSEPGPIGSMMEQVVLANGGELPSDDFADIDFGNEVGT